MTTTSRGRTRRSGASSGTSWPVASAAAVPQILEPDLVRACEVSEVRRERGPLQVRQHATDGVAPAGVDRLAQRAIGTDEDGARDEQLGDVDVERRLRGAERRRRQVHQHRPAVGRARTLPALSLPWEIAGVVEPGDLLPEPSSVSSLTSSGRELSSGSTSGWRVTINASPLGPRAAVTTSGTRTPACAAMSVASASCSTCSRRPTAALRGGSR